MVADSIVHNQLEAIVQFVGNWLLFFLQHLTYFALEMPLSFSENVRQS